MTNAYEVRPMPGRPALVSHQNVNLMAQEGRVPLVIVAALNVRRRQHMVAAKKDMVATKKAQKAA